MVSAVARSPDLFTATDELAQILGPDLAKAFIDHRRMLKKPMTAFAGQLMAKKLRGFPDPVAAVEQAILKGWCDVWPVEPLQKAQQFAGRTPLRGVEAEREKLRQEIEDERQGKADQNSGHAGGLSLVGWREPGRPH